MKQLALIVAIAGCGRISFDVAGDGRGTDADIAMGPWSSPTVITALASTNDDEEPTFTDDGLELIFRSGPITNQDLFVSKRASVGGAHAGGSAQHHKQGVRADGRCQRDLVRAKHRHDRDDLARDTGSAGIAHELRTSARSSKRTPRTTTGTHGSHRTVTTSCSAVTAAPRMTSTRCRAERGPGYSSSSVRALAAVMVVVTGCGRIGFDVAARSDTNVASGPFSLPTLITALATSPDDEEATFTADRLELMYRNINQDLLVSKRASVADPWGAPVLIAELNTSSGERTPGLAADGLTLWFSSDRPGGAGGYDIWVTTRPDRNSTWSTPVNLVDINTADDEFSPMRDASGLWWDREPNQSSVSIWHATPASATTWTNIQKRNDFPSGTLQGSPRTWAGGLRFVYNCDLSDAPTTDIWEASRTSLADPFTGQMPMPDVSSVGHDDFDPWISEDGHYLVFGSDRSGVHHIYETSR